MKKCRRDIIILRKCSKNHDHMLYCSWDMARDRSSIVNEVIRAIHLFIFFMKIFYTHKKAYKAPKQRLLRYL